MLCHCRKAGVPIANSVVNFNFLPNLSEYDITTVDRNPDSDPHIVCDILTPDLEKELEGKRFDLVALFNCSCHTPEVNEDPNILSRLSKIVKDDGFFLLKNNNIVKRNILNYEGVLYLSFEILGLLSSTSIGGLFDSPDYLSNERHMFIYSFRK